MASPFETVILRLGDLGFFQFVLPFLLTAAIFYGLLRKSKVFGEPQENVAVNAIVALVAGFMVWAYPILAGVDIQTQFSTFIFQATLAMFAIMVGVLIAGMFLPADLPAKVGEAVKGGKGVGIIIIGGILIVGGLVFSSGLGKIFIPAGLFGGPGGFIGFAGVDSTTILSAIVILAMAVVVFAIAWGGPGGKK